VQTTLCSLKRMSILWESDRGVQFYLPEYYVRGIFGLIKEHGDEACNVTWMF
jgi:hypothetical protein